MLKHGVCMGKAEQTTIVQADIEMCNEIFSYEE